MRPKSLIPLGLDLTFTIRMRLPLQNSPLARIGPDLWQISESVASSNMGDVNQFEWVKKQAHRVSGPILEIGSKHYAKVSYDYRSLFAGHGTYVGTDMAPGD